MKEAQDTEDLDLQIRGVEFGSWTGRYKTLLIVVFISQKDFIWEMVLPVKIHGVQRSDAVIIDVSYLKCNWIYSCIDFYFWVPVKSKFKYYFPVWAASFI